MKKIFIILFLLTSLSALAEETSCQDNIINPLSDTTTLPQILNLPLQSFIGKPVDSLLNLLPGGYTKRSFMPSKLGHIKGVYQVYGTEGLNHCTVEIFIDTFQFLPTPNYIPARNWSMSLAKQEKIAFIKVLKSNTCVYGCNNLNYY